MTEPTKTFLKDQTQAATEEAHNYIKEVGEVDGALNGHEGAEEIPAPVLWSSYVGRLFKWIDDVAARKRLTFCKHASFRAPGMFVIIANRPNHVDCFRCGSRRLLRRGEPINHPCDMCDEGSSSTDSMMQMGNFIACAYLCSTCETEQKESIKILTAQWKEQNMDEWVEQNIERQEDAQDS